MFFGIKKKIIAKNFAKKKKNEPFRLEESELYELKKEEDSSVNNSYFFTAHGINGDCVILRLGIRNGRDDEIFFYYKKDGVLYVQPQFEYKKEESPAKVKCVCPGKEWHFTFLGKLKEFETGMLHDFVIDAKFVATRDIFDFFLHSDSHSMIEAIAREKWTKEFFAEIGKNNQRHYEQTGKLTGKVKMDGGEEKPFSYPCVRDHSFGTRNWDYMDDHIWLCGLTEKGEVINFSFVNYPVMKRILVGYTDIGSKEQFTIVDYDLSNYDFNEGMGPDKLTIPLTFSNGKKMTLTCVREENIAIPFGDNKYIFQEAIGIFDIDGVKGRGTIEYGFNTNPARWNEKKK